MIPIVIDPATTPRRLAGSVGLEWAGRLVDLGARRFTQPRRFTRQCRASSPEELTGAALDPRGRLRPEVQR